MKRGTATYIGAQMVRVSDGLPHTSGTVNVHACMDNGIALEIGPATHISWGHWRVLVPAEQTQCDHLALQFIDSSGTSISVTLNVYPKYDQTGDSFARIGATGSGLTSLAQASVNTETRLARLDANVSSVGALSVADIWAYATRSLTDKTGYTVSTVQDKTGYSLSTAGIAAIWDALTNAMTATGSVGKRIVDYLNAAITSRSSHTASDVWAVETRAITANQDKTGYTVSTVQDKTDYSLSTPGIQALWDHAVATLSVAGSIGKRIVDFLTGDAFARIGANGAGLSTLAQASVATEERLSKLDVPVSSRSSHSASDVLAAITPVVAPTTLGLGAIPWTHFVANEYTMQGIPDVDVWVSTDPAGAYIIASGRTDQNGNVTFYLDAGTVYVWEQKSGWNFSNPTEEVVE